MEFLKKNWFKVFVIIALFSIALVILFYSQGDAKTGGDTFKKKQECAGYKNDIMESLTRYGNYPTNFEIFFSPKENSCLYSYMSSDSYENLSGKPTMSTSFIITDWLTGKSVYYDYYSTDSTGNDFDGSVKKFESARDELKK